IQGWSSARHQRFNILRRHVQETDWIGPSCEDTHPVLKAFKLIQHPESLQQKHLFPNLRILSWTLARPRGPGLDEMHFILAPTLQELHIAIPDASRLVLDGDHDQDCGLTVEEIVEQHSTTMEFLSINDLASIASLRVEALLTPAGMAQLMVLLGSVLTHPTDIAIHAREMEDYQLWNFEWPFRQHLQAVISPIPSLKHLELSSDWTIAIIKDGLKRVAAFLPALKSLKIFQRNRESPPFAEPRYDCKFSLLEQVALLLPDIQELAVPPHFFIDEPGPLIPAALYAAPLELHLDLLPICPLGEAIPGQLAHDPSEGLHYPDPKPAWLLLLLGYFNLLLPVGSHVHSVGCNTYEGYTAVREIIQAIDARDIDP
ncbi:hypothetical protein FRB90_000817, partial [Tulasnella sp. 427]